MHAKPPVDRHRTMALAPEGWREPRRLVARRGPVYPERLQAAGYQIGFARKGAGPSKYEYTHRDPFGARFNTFGEFFAQRQAGEPFCFWYGAGEPHRPYRYREGERAGIDPAKVKLPACLPDNRITRRDFADYLHRIQRYDSDCARMLALLEKSGELENTIIVMAGDNGLPFPRCKSTLYDTGTHVPLAIRWGANVKGGRTVSDFVSLTDLAPTFLDATALKTPAEITGRSLLPILESGRSGQVDAAQTRRASSHKKSQIGSVRFDWNQRRSPIIVGLLARYSLTVASWDSARTIQPKLRSSRKWFAGESAS